MSNSRKEQIDFTKTELDHARDNTFIEMLDILAQKANDNATDLADYGVTATTITDFETARNQFIAIVNKPRTAIANRLSLTRISF